MMHTALNQTTSNCSFDYLQRELICVSNKVSKIYFEKLKDESSGSGSIISISKDGIESRNVELYSKKSLKSKEAITAQKQIEHLRMYMDLNISEIAHILKVERPTIYEWIRGNEPNPNNQKRLDEIYAFCEIWKNFEVGGLSNFLYKKFNGGKTLFELLSDSIPNEKMIGERMEKIKDILIQQRKEREERRIVLKRENFKPVDKKQRKELIRRITGTIS